MAEYRRGIAFRQALDLVQVVLQGVQRFMGNFRKTGADRLRIADLARSRLETVPRVLDLAPEIIGDLAGADQKAVEHRIVGDRAVASFPQQPDDSPDRVKTFDKEKKPVVRAVVDPFEGRVECWQKIGKPVLRAADNLLQIQQQVVHRIRANVFIHVGLDDLAEYSDHGLSRFHSPGVGLKQMKVVQCVPACLPHDKLPIAIGMAQFPKEGVHPFHQPEVAGHDRLNTFIAGIDGNIHIGAGQVGF